MQAPHRSPLDVLAEELGTVAGQIERETNLRLTAAIADLKQRESERELRFSKLERLIEERLASLKDGEPGRAVTVEDVVPALISEIDRRFSDLPRPADGKSIDPAEVRAMVEEAVSALPMPRAGKDADPEDVSRLVAETVERAVAALPAPLDGKSVTVEELQPVIDETVHRAVMAIPPPKAGDKGEPGEPGKLPIAQAWSDRVHYESQVVTHAGGLYQATRDTAKEPPHEDWICLASAGRDGIDGRSFTIRGTFKDDGDYRELDVVTLNGASFAAKQDNPGPCPGEGWQIIAMQGGRGKPGERPTPIKGDRGPPGPKVAALTIDEHGLMTLKNEDGSLVTCDLYPVLAKI